MKTVGHWVAVLFCLALSVLPLQADPYGFTIFSNSPWASRVNKTYHSRSVSDNLELFEIKNARIEVESLERTVSSYEDLLAHTESDARRISNKLEALSFMAEDISLSPGLEQYYIRLFQKLYGLYCTTQQYRALLNAERVALNDRIKKSDRLQEERTQKELKRARQLGGWYADLARAYEADVRMRRQHESAKRQAREWREKIDAKNQRIIGGKYGRDPFRQIRHIPHPVF